MFHMYIQDVPDNASQYHTVRCNNNKNVNGKTYNCIAKGYLPLYLIRSRTSSHYHDCN